MRINTKAAACCLLFNVFYACFASALTVFSCEPEWKALVEVLAPNSQVFSATKALQDPHHIQARPGLIAEMRKADVAVCTGAELEIGWLPLLQKKSANPKVQDGKKGMFYVADHVDTIGKLDRVDPTMGDVHPQGNPHVHLDPYRLLTISQSLAERLASIDPENAHTYRSNAKAFSNRWEENIQRWEEQARLLRGKQVIGYHTSFEYLFQWLGLNMVGDLEPKPGLEPSGTHLAELVDLINSQPVDAITFASYQNRKWPKQLSEKAGVPVIELPISVNNNSTKTLEQLYERLMEQLLTIGQNSV